MRFVEHGVYLVRNRRTREATYFEAREIIEYKGQSLLYGEMRPHQIRIHRGVIEWEGRPSCLVAIRRESVHGRAWALTTLATGGDEGTGLVDRFWMSFVGSPGQGQATPTGAVKAVAPGSETPLLTCGRQIYEWWGGKAWRDSARTVPNRDGLFRATRRVVDLYLDCVALGEIPGWYKDVLRACLYHAARSTSALYLPR